MNLETLKQVDKKYAQAIADYLLNRIETDLCLKEKLESTNKTLKGCVFYVKSEAKKQAEDSVAIIQDNEVYEWSVHYFLEDSIDFEPKEKAAKKIKVEESKEEKIETLFGEETVIVNETKKKATKQKKNIKEDLEEQLSLFDL